MQTFKHLCAALIIGITSITPIAAHAEPIPLDRVAVVVNDSIIMNSEVDQRVRDIKLQLTSRNAAMPADEVLRGQVQEQLILESIQLQLAEKQGLRVSDQELNQTMERIASQNNLSLADFRKALLNEGRDYQQVRDQVRREMLISRVQQNNVNRRVSVTDQEVQNYLNSDLAKQQDSTEFLLNNILISVPSPASPQQIQDAKARAEQIQAELTNGANFLDIAVRASDAPNALNGGDLGWRKATELPSSVFSAVAGLKVGEVSEIVRTPSGFNLLFLRDRRGEQATIVTETRARHILVAPSEIRSGDQAKAFAEEIYGRIKEGEPFDELARRYSDDPGSGSLGGELGWIQPGKMVAEFEQQMDKLGINEVSLPFESRFGWHIVQVQERRQQDFSTEMRENKARKEIRKRKYDEALSVWLREQRSEAYIDVKAN
jgi:peptidyl-prolyl cis-trans isomerase SurA